MKTPAIISIALASMSSTLATAGSIGPVLGSPVPALSAPSIPMGVAAPVLGDAAATGLTLPMMAAIGAISLLAGIRYIRNKRS